jgi:hypothetical protein
MTGAERKREDAISVERMRQAAERYNTESHYRPFTLTWPSHAGGVGSEGIKTDEMQGYQTVVSS